MIRRIARIGANPDRPSSIDQTNWIVEQWEIVAALAHRDFRTRFSQNRFGYYWTFIAPLLWIAGTYGFFVFFGRTSPVYADLLTFIISGLIPYVAFRYTVNAMGRVNGLSRSLLIYPTVSREHVAFAAALVEFGNLLVLSALIMSINYFVFGNWELDNFLPWLAGIGLAWLLGAGYGYFFSVLSVNDLTVFQFGVILLRPSYFLSAVFFTPNEIRGDVWAVLQWNPLLHAIELSRDGMLFHYQSRVDDPWYVVSFIALLFIAAFVARAWKRG